MRVSLSDRVDNRPALGDEELGSRPLVAPGVCHRTPRRPLTCTRYVLPILPGHVSVHQDCVTQAPGQNCHQGARSYTALGRARAPREPSRMPQRCPSAPLESSSGAAGGGAGGAGPGTDAAGRAKDATGRGHGRHWAGHGRHWAGHGRRWDCQVTAGLDIVDVFGNRRTPPSAAIDRPPASSPRAGEGPGENRPQGAPVCRTPPPPFAQTPPEPTLWDTPGGPAHPHPSADLACRSPRSRATFAIMSATGNRVRPSTPPCRGAADVPPAGAGRPRVRPVGEAATRSGDKAALQNSRLHVVQASYVCSTQNENDENNRDIA